MTGFKRAGSAAIITTLLGSTAAVADVTAQDVWDKWQQSMTIYGEDVVTVGSEEMSGDTLTITDLVIDFTNADSAVNLDLGEITMTEQGDGTVLVTMPENSPLTLAVTGDDGAPVSIQLNLRQEQAEWVVSGTPEEMVFDMTAARYAVEFESLEGADDDMVVNAAALVISDIEGSYSLTEDTLSNVDYAASFGQVSMMLDAEQADGPGVMNFLATIDGLETEVVASVPTDVDPDAPEDFFVEGMMVDAAYDFGPTNYAFTFLDGEDSAEGTAGAESGSMEISLTRDGVSYQGGVQAPRLSITSGEFPFPVEVSMSEYSYGITVPLSSTEEVTDFGVNLTLADVAVNDMIWGLADPGGQLPHDPITVALDLSGTGKLFFDLVDPEQAEAMMMADMPGELESLTLNDLHVSAVGAELMGEGDFTFDNTDLETFPGFPRPTGAVEIKLNGANALIDTLVEMGLVPEQQVMGARMMMGMFARSVGDDQLESKLEINEDGHVIANGQRIQ